MVVTTENFKRIVEDIYRSPLKGFDTETYGVRHQDRLFSLIVSTPQDTYYFNFNNDTDHLGHAPEVVLRGDNVWPSLIPCFYNGVWASHNAQFDKQKLRLETGASPMHIHCTLSTERVLRNDFLDYSLEAVAPRYGLEKDMSVEAYIKEHKLYSRVFIPGKKTVTHVPHYDKVPFRMMVEYGCKDAKIHRQIAQMQRAALGLQ